MIQSITEAVIVDSAYWQEEARRLKEDNERLTYVLAQFQEKIKLLEEELEEVTLRTGSWKES